MDLELLKLILAQMAAQGSPITDNVLTGASSLPSASSLAGAMNPETLVALGLLNPQSINAGVDAQLSKLMTEYAKKNAPAPVKFEASPAYFQNTLSPFGITAQIDPSGRLAQFNENTGNKIQDIVSAGLNAIASGRLTADQIIAGMAKDIVDNPNDYQGVQDYATQIQGAWKDFESKYKNFGDAVAKYQYDTANSAADSAIAPTRQQAMNEYYNSIGAPQLSLLGDPNAGYKFDPLTFADPNKLKALSEAVNRASTVTQRETNRVSDGMVSSASKAQDVYTAKGIDESAKAYATKVANSKVKVFDRSKSLGAAGALSTLIPFVAPVALSAAHLGSTGRQTEDKKKWQSTYEEAFKREKARLLADAAKQPKVSAETFSTDLRLAKAKQYTAEKALQDELSYNQQVADLVSQGLAAQGKTPFNANLQQILAYATAPKKK